MDNPHLSGLKEQIPDYARNQKRNLEVLINSTVLTNQQKWGCFFVAAALSKNAAVLKAIAAQAQEMLSENALKVALECISVMTLNNCGFRAKHWLGDEFDTVRFGLRNTVELKPGINQADYEAWAIVASAINSCEQCTQEHSRRGQAEGLSREQIWEAVKISSVICSLANTLDVHEVLDN